MAQQVNQTQVNQTPVNNQQSQPTVDEDEKIEQEELSLKQKLSKKIGQYYKKHNTTYNNEFERW